MEENSPTSGDYIWFCVQPYITYNYLAKHHCHIVIADVVRVLLVNVLGQQHSSAIDVDIIRRLLCIAVFFTSFCIQNRRTKVAIFYVSSSPPSWVVSVVAADAATWLAATAPCFLRKCIWSCNMSPHCSCLCGLTLVMQRTDSVTHHSHRLIFSRNAWHGRPAPMPGETL